MSAKLAKSVHVLAGKAYVLACVEIQLIKMVKFND